MLRGWRLIALVALIGALSVLAFPADGSALSAAFIQLTQSGPPPSDLTIPAGMYPVWVNQDQVTHTVVFADGLCSFQLAPGAYGQCDFGFSVGRYPYTVDGTVQASIVVSAPPPDTVTLTARQHSLRRDAQLRLHGLLSISQCCGPPPPRLEKTPVVVMARPDRHHAFHRLARAASGGRRQEAGYPWWLNVHPRKATIYIAEVTYEPAGEQGSRQAWSRPFKVLVRR
jgi:hypothetical protein